MPPFALFFLTRFPSLFSPSQLFIFASIAFFKINNLSVFHILDHCPIPSFSFLFSHVTCNPHCAAKLLFGLIVIVALYSILAPLHFWSVLKLFIFQMSRPRSQLSLPYVLPRIRKTINRLYILWDCEIPLIPLPTIPSSGEATTFSLPFFKLAGIVFWLLVGFPYFCTLPASDKLLRTNDLDKCNWTVASISLTERIKLVILLSKHQQLFVSAFYRLLGSMTSPILISWKATHRSIISKFIYRKLYN